MATAEEFDEVFQGLLENNPNDALLVSQDDTLTAVNTALATGIAEHGDRAYDFNDQLFLDTATGERLERLAEVVNTFRRTDESDTKLRVRTKAAYAQATSDTTIGDFATVVKIVLDTDADSISLSGANGDVPVVTLTVTKSVIDNSPLTQNEIIKLINKSVPAGHNVVIIFSGTFRLDGPNYQPPSDSGLNGGTLTGEI